MLVVSCYIDREYGSFIGSCFKTVISVICFSSPVISSGLSCFDSLAFDILNLPSWVNLLDHEILNNY